MPSHQYFLNEAYNEAKKAFTHEEVPIGCVIVQNNLIIAKGYNQKETQQDCTSHAEINAIKQASQRLHSWRLLECIVYTTCEPCAMCAAALLHARVKMVVFSAWDTKWGGESVLEILSKKWFNHQIDMLQLNHAPSQKILTHFFNQQR